MIIVDDREPQELDLKLIQRGVFGRRERRTVGDFHWFDCNDEPVLVSRKSSDLITSINSGHFGDELEGLLNVLNGKYVDSPHLWVIIEGLWTPRYGGRIAWERGYQEHRADAPEQIHRGNPQTLVNLSTALCLAGIRTIYTANLNETADALQVLYHLSQEGWPVQLPASNKFPPLHKVKKRNVKDTRVARLRSLVKGLPIETAYQLIERYITPFKVVETAIVAPQNMKDIKGVGDKTIANLQEVLR